MSPLLEDLGLVKRPKIVEPALIAIEGRSIEVSFRRNARARRLVLRLSRDRSGIIVTLPPRVSRREALDFARKSSRWIGDRLKSEPAARPLCAGGAVVIRGESRQIESPIFALPKQPHGTKRSYKYIRRAFAQADCFS